MKFTLLASLAAITNAVDIASELEAAAAARKKSLDYMQGLYEKNNVVMNFDIPEDFCLDGIKKIVKKVPAVMAMENPDCMSGHFIKGAMWHQKEGLHYPPGP